MDGLSADSDVSENFRSKLADLLNNSEDANACQDLLDDFRVNLSLSHHVITDVFITEEVVEESLLKLGRDKSDGTSLSSNHLILASPVIASFLSHLFTLILRHGYMPKALRDCLLIPIPKPNKDPSLSDSYRPIALAPNLSKVLESCILIHYQSCLTTSDLQFGFKRGFSTTTCTSILKNVVSKYIHRGSAVYSCFLDASKAFDRVNHKILFQLLLKRNLPVPILRFLLSWYQSQSLSVRWNSTFSTSFGVSNGVRQGGVLSPLLFAVYIDELLIRLERLRTGCYSGCFFVGALCYADDIVLLAPSPSALRILLSECECFSRDSELNFNTSKTQLICFRLKKNLVLPDGMFCFFGHILSFSNCVHHLGHVLSFNLDDSEDINRVSMDMSRKANYLLHTFKSCSPLVKTFLFTSHCLSLYGAVSWFLCSKQIKCLEATFNNVLRKIWNLPKLCHTRILHCVAGVQSVYNTLVHLTSSAFSKAIASDCGLIRHCFLSSSASVYTFTGFNSRYKYDFIKKYSNDDITCANFVRDIRLNLLLFDSVDITNSIMYSICCD